MLSERPGGLLPVAHNLQRTLLDLGSRLPLRRRYLLTRAGRLRLRYIVTPALAVGLLAATSGASLLHGDAAFKVARIMPSGMVEESVDEGLTLGERYAAMNRRINRYVRGTDSSEYGVLPARKPEAVALAIAPLEPREEMVKIGKGDTLGGVLQKAGISGDEVHRAVEALTEFYDPRSIKPGQMLALHFDPANEQGSGEGEDYNFSRLSMRVDPLKTVSLEKGEDGTFEAKVMEKTAERRIYARRAPIETSLYGSALKAGVPAAVVADTIKIFSFDVDFQRDLRRGDVAEVMYELYETDDGAPIRAGDVIFARLNIGGTETSLYRYETKDGRTDYYTASGASIRKSLLSTPIDGARLSSGFGVRRHPVLGYTKMHKGVDFAAATGTPIYAAGDGVIEHLGKWSSYGNYIRIRHNGSTKTAYAHMSRFNKGLATGSRVKQGQVIGYVGTTGRSTGPHLHYEVLVNGTQVNPRSLKLPQGDKLTGPQLAAFKDHVRAIDQRYVELTGSAKFADAGGLIRSRLQ